MSTEGFLKPGTEIPGMCQKRPRQEQLVAGVKVNPIYSKVSVVDHLEHGEQAGEDERFHR